LGVGSAPVLVELNEETQAIDVKIAAGKAVFASMEFFASILILFITRQWSFCFNFDIIYT